MRDNTFIGVTIDLPELLELRVKARRLELSPRNKVLATRSGGHLSHFRGRGMEFDESRPYQPGDEVRNMDWRVTARTGIPYVKMFREERERPVWLLVDMGPSMRFGTRVAFKSVIAARITGLLAWAAADRGDRIGGAVFDETKRFENRPAARTRGVLPLLQALAQPPLQTSTEGLDLTGAVVRLQHHVRAGSLVCIISDFAKISQDYTAWLAQLSYGNELIFVHVYDPIEKFAPPAGRYPVINNLHYGIIDTRTNSQRDVWRRRFMERLNLLEMLTSQHQAHLLNIATADPLEESLISGLRARSSVQDIVCNL